MGLDTASSVSTTCLGLDDRFFGLLCLGLNDRCFRLNYRSLSLNDRCFRLNYRSLGLNYRRLGLNDRSLSCLRSVSGAWVSFACVSGAWVSACVSGAWDFLGLGLRESLGSSACVPQEPAFCLSLQSFCLPLLGFCSLLFSVSAVTAITAANNLNFL